MPTLRSLARFVRHLPDRLLHPWRRRRAVARLGSFGTPRSVLVLCHGNICRSPYAESALRSLLPVGLREAISVGSAGFYGPNRASPDGAVRAAARRDVDLSGHRSRAVTEALLREADIVVVMDTRQRRASRRLSAGSAGTVVLLGDLDPRPIDTRVVRDPIDQPDAVFDASYSRIDRCLAVMVAAMSGSKDG